MMIEKRTIRSDIPGHHTFLNNGNSYSGSDDTRRMVVGRDITLQGDVAACDHLVIEGTMKAEGLTAKHLDVTAPGLFTGTAEVQNAMIAGRVEGTLKVTGRLTIKSTGHVMGEISCGILEVENGGKITGQMTALDRPEAHAQQTANRTPGRKILPSNVKPLFDDRKEKRALTEEKEGRPQAFRRTEKVN